MPKKKIFGNFFTTSEIDVPVFYNSIKLMKGGLEMNSFVEPLPESPISKKIKKEIRQKLEKESKDGKNKTAAKIALELMKLNEKSKKWICW